MGLIGETIESFKSIKIRRAISQAVSFVMIWKALMCWTGSESPVVVVLSESMEPGFARHMEFHQYAGRAGKHLLVICNKLFNWIKPEADPRHFWNQGDILFLHMNKDPIRAGEIVVYNVEGRDIPIVHRVIKVHEMRDTGEVYLLTKGDNNEDDDIGLYAEDQLWLQRQHIMGKAVGFLPYVGWATIIMTDKPIIKYILIGALGLLVLISKD